jgi:hypothetical protein
VACRALSSNSFTGPLPTELGTMDALTSLCVRPHPPRLHACAVTGLWAVGAQSSDAGDDGRVRGVEQWDSAPCLHS